MTTYEEICNYICRVCLSHGNSENTTSLIDISSEDGLNCFGRSVKKFANISIKSDDNLPTVMCWNCLNLLKHAIRFKLMCESNDVLLKTVVKCVESDCAGNNLKEKMVQYILYRRYFPETQKQGIISESCNKKDIKPPSISNEVNTKNLMPVVQTVDGGDYENFDSDSLMENSDKNDVLLDRIEKHVKTNKIIRNAEHRRHKKKRRLKYVYKSSRSLTIQQNKLNFQNMKKVVGKIMVHKKENKTCEICHRVLSNRLTFEHHMQRHNGCRFICEHCGKGFPVLAELQIHQVQLHGTGRPFECKECGYKAPRKYELTEHERIHTGERPYACEKCGLTFRRRLIWKKHLIYHTEKNVQCPQCPRKFFRRSEMLAHANNIHERVYVYMCHKCGATYAKTATVRRHLTERHGIPREQQGKIIRINKGKDTFPEQ